MAIVLNAWDVAGGGDHSMTHLIYYLVAPKQTLTPGDMPGLTPCRSPPPTRHLLRLVSHTTSIRVRASNHATPGSHGLRVPPHLYSPAQNLEGRETCPDPRGSPAQEPLPLSWRKGRAAFSAKVLNPRSGVFGTLLPSARDNDQAEATGLSWRGRWLEASCHTMAQPWHYLGQAALCPRQAALHTPAKGLSLKHNKHHFPRSGHQGPATSLWIKPRLSTRLKGPRDCRQLSVLLGWGVPGQRMARQLLHQKIRDQDRPQFPLSRRHPPSPPDLHEVGPELSYALLAPPPQEPGPPGKEQQGPESLWLRGWRNSLIQGTHHPTRLSLRW